MSSEKERDLVVWMHKKGREYAAWCGALQEIEVEVLRRFRPDLLPSAKFQGRFVLEEYPGLVEFGMNTMWLYMKAN